ncbi:MAG: MarR family transcriptional regulator [Elusimicrobia bacterium]|nr:MarR family transcriptional regulator [Elusimicrobiota bacterium]
MGLKDELGLPHKIVSEDHELLLSVVLAAQMLEKEADRLLARFGLTRSQLNILMLLRYQSREPGPDHQSLGRMLVVNRSNVTGLLDRMEAAKLVERAADPEDRRVKRVRLTPKGFKILVEAEKVYMRHVEELAGAIPPADRAVLCRILEALRRRLRRGSPQG